MTRTAEKARGWKSAGSAGCERIRFELAELAIFFATTNFDLKYFGSFLMTYNNVQYLIWKIWFISVWRQKPKAQVWLLAAFMLGQNTLISYHTEAHGCIFFPAGVQTIEIKDCIWQKYFTCEVFEGVIL